MELSELKEDLLRDADLECWYTTSIIRFKTEVGLALLKSVGQTHYLATSTMCSPRPFLNKFSISPHQLSRPPHTPSQPWSVIHWPSTYVMTYLDYGQRLSKSVLGASELQDIQMDGTSLERAATATTANRQMGLLPTMLHQNAIQTSRGTTYHSKHTRPKSIKASNQ